MHLSSPHYAADNVVFIRGTGTRPKWLLSSLGMRNGGRSGRTFQKAMICMGSLL